MVIERIDPLRNSGLSRIDFLSAANQANNDRPVFSLIQRPDEERRLGDGKIRHLQFVSISPASFEVIRQALMCPCPLCFIENGDVLHLSISRMLHFDSFGGIDFKDSIFDRILNLREHVIPITVDDLEEFTHLPPRIREIFLLSLILAFLLIVNGQSFRQDSNERTVTRQIYGAVLLVFFSVLIALFDRHVQPDQRLSCTGNTCHETDAFLTSLLARPDHLEEVVNGRIRGYFIRLVARNILHGMILI